MKAPLQRPLLIGGAALSVGVWMLHILENAFGEWSVYALFATLLGTGAWWLQQRPGPTSGSVLPLQPLEPEMVQRAIAEAERVIHQLDTETTEPIPGATAQPTDISRLRSQVSQLATDLDRDLIRLIFMGNKGSGKSSVIDLMRANWTAPVTVTLQEAPSFFAGTDVGLTADAIALQQSTAADLVIYLVTGDITETEFQIVISLSARKRVLLVLNKRDQYLPEEQAIVLTRLRERLAGILVPQDILAITAAPAPLKVRRHQEDGPTQEWLEEQPSDIAPLTSRLETVLQDDRQQLVLASSLDHAAVIKAQAKQVLNDVRRVRAMPVVEKYQWISAGAAFASPLPTLDVLATAAINVQMILDVAALHQQKLSLQQGQKVATTLASLMLKQGVVELTTQAIAGFMKTNAVTYVAGGVIQGLSAAYLTRVAGLSLIDYFSTQEPYLTPAEAKPLALDRLSQSLQTVFQQNRQTNLLQTFMGQAIEHLGTWITAAQPSTAREISIPRSTPENTPVLDQHKLEIPLKLPNLESVTLPSKQP